MDSFRLGGVILKKPIWYLDYIRTTDDSKLIWRHFIKDFIFQHRLRYMVYFRYAQTTHNPLLRLFCEFKMYRMCRKYGIELKTQTQIGPGFIMVHPYNITITPYAVIGKNVNILKGATIGLNQGKYPGAPTIGDSVYIGINSTILGGINIGDDVMIAPNTFVDRDVPSHCIVLGNPCKIIPRENATGQYINYRV